MILAHCVGEGGVVNGEKNNVINEGSLTVLQRLQNFNE